jgi:MSHA biogenesis protein MshL
MAEAAKGPQHGKASAAAPAPDLELLPPMRMEMPSVAGRPIEPRFDLVVNNALAQQVFAAIVSGTRYNMLVHPSVTGTISVSLKDVNVLEALDAIRDLYGYEYKIDGTRIFVQPAGLQSRVYQINYLQGQRRGSSDVRVQSGSVSDVGTGGAPGLPSTSTGAPGAVPGSLAPTGVPGTVAASSRESSRISTQISSDLWRDLREALTTIVGTGEGRSIVMTPQSGVVVVRALPQEHRAVEQYLKATKLSIERQVMLEAKIIEVTLSNSYQSGINWALFGNGGRAAIGQISSSSGQSTTLGAAGQVLSSSGVSIDPAARTIVTLGAGALASANPAGAVFGLALQTSNFASLLQFLETQGSVQVLSSPRVATLNNTKAVLKVGTDNFFVTNVTTTTITSGTATQTSPSVTVQPFFSGIVLDVTPQIDDASMVTLHVHPSVSEVTQKDLQVNLGGTFAAIVLPLAQSAVSETDTIVRVSDGNIVAIGGLMSVGVQDNRGGLPGAPSTLRNNNVQMSKKELVILLKPTLIQSDRSWDQDLEDTRARLRNLYPAAPQQPAGGAAR